MADNKLQIRIAASDEASGAFDKIQRKMTDLNNQVDKTSRRFTEINSAITSMAGAISLVGVAALTKDMLGAGLQLEKLNKLFNAATGSASLGGREFEYIRDLSEKMGLSFVDSAQSYGKFTAAMRGTSMEGEQGRKVFEAVSGATTALGLSADETSGVFNALQQMISKGKVQAEELRGQLGERLPGAFKLAADAMGVSTAELDKMLQKGEVVASDLLPKLAEQLNKTYGVAATEGAKSAAAELNRMNNAMFDAKAAAGAALIPALTDIAKAMVPIVQKVQEFIGGVQILSVKAAGLWDRMSHTSAGGTFEEKIKNMANYKAMSKAAEESAIADIMKKNTLQGSDYTAAEKAAQALRSKMQAGQPLSEKAIKAAQKEAAAWRKAEAAEEREQFQYMKKEADAWHKAEAAEEREQYKYKHMESEAWRKAEAADLKDRYAYEQRMIKENAQLKTQQAQQQYDLGSIKNNTLGMWQNQPDPYQSLDIDYTRESAIIQAKKAELEELSNLDAQQLSEHQYFTDRLSAIDEQYAAQKKQIDAQNIASIGDSLGKIGSIMMKGNKEQFEAGKKLAIASATIQMFSAGMAAFAGITASTGGWGMAAGIAEMAAVIATGTAQIAQISATQYDGREFGGPVLAGQSYLVGERRPEIFTPSQSGWITPNTSRSGGTPINTTQVFQISTGVAETTRAEIMRAAPSLMQMSVAAVKSAMRDGAFQGA